MASTEGCVVETCADSTKQPEGEVNMFVGLSLCSYGGNEITISSCKLPGAPHDVSPKSVSSFTDVPSLMESIPIFKSHKRQRSDAMVENSPAQDSFLVRQHSYVAESQQGLERVDTEHVCKPRAVYPINFKAPKMNNSSQSRRSSDLEIPVSGGGGSSAVEWRSPSDHSELANFNVGFFNKGSFHTNTTVSDHRRLSRHRSRANSFNNSGMYEAVDALSEDGDHSQISIDLERISLAATSFSPFTSPRPTLRPSPLLPVVFSPIQHVAYRKFEEFSIVEEQEEDEEDQELVKVNLPKDEIDDASTTCDSAVLTQNSHINHHHQHYPHNSYHHISSVTSTSNTGTIPLTTFDAAHTVHGIPHHDSDLVESSELLDDEMLIFNMDA